jgi:hypothetical protein
MHTTYLDKNKNIVDKKKMGTIHEASIPRNSKMVHTKHLERAWLNVRERERNRGSKTKTGRRVERKRG